MAQSELIDIIRSADPDIRNRSLDGVCASLDTPALLAECRALDVLRRQTPNLFERVRAMTFLYAIHRFHLGRRPELDRPGHIPYRGYTYLLERR